MERSKIVAIFHLLDHLVGDEYALVEFLTTMHHTVTDSVNLTKVLYAPFLGVGEYVENSFHTLFVVDMAKLFDLFAAVGTLELQKAVGESDFLHAALGHGDISVGVNQFVFHRAAAAVKHKYFHIC